MRRWRKFVALWLWLISVTTAWAAAPSMPDACTPAILRVQMAPDVDASATEDGLPARPVSGWQDVTLPHEMPTDLSGNDSGTVWYRIDWVRPCPDVPVALGLDGINMSGEVYLGNMLLWRDAHLSEPMSRSWNLPRQWQLMESQLQGALPPVWIRVHGVYGQTIGLRRVVFDTPAAVDDYVARKVWSQRTLHFINLTISGVLGFIFLFIWLTHRSQIAFGWFALMSLFWVLFISNVLTTRTWPFPDGATVARANVSALLLYMACLVQFVRHFVRTSTPDRSDQSTHPLKRWGWHLMWTVWVLTFAVVWLTGTPRLETAKFVATSVCTLMFIGACLFGAVRSWRTGHPEDRLMALCLVSFIGLSIHDILMFTLRWDDALMLTPYAAPITTLSMAAVLGWRIARNTKRIARFNDELSIAIAQAQEELRTTLVREHDLALTNTRLQERLSIAQDLHDGLGGSLVRSMAWVEQSQEAVRGDQFLSMLKVLRDDLRQVIDTSSSHGLSVPASPVAWGAPLRHRFTRLFDELGIRSDWHFPREWLGGLPATLSCLMLMRVVEEAMTNVLKHSQARHVRVQLAQPDEDSLVLRIEDDGVGFDVQGALHGGLSIGMRSMQARVQRVHGTLDIHSQPGHTSIEVRIPLSPQNLNDNGKGSDPAS